MRELRVHQRLKKAFLSEKIVETHKQRQAAFQELRLRRQSSEKGVNSGGTGTCSGTGGDMQENSGEEKEEEVWLEGEGEEGSRAHHQEEMKWQALKQLVLSAHTSLFAQEDSCMDFNTFCRVMHDCGLQEWGTPEAFRLFDIDGSGRVQMREFLLSIMALRSTAASAERSNSSSSRCGMSRRSSARLNPSVGDEPCTTADADTDTDDEAWDGHQDCSARLFFRLFDLSSSGYIDAHELRLVAKCFLKTDHVLRDNREEKEKGGEMKQQQQQQQHHAEDTAWEEALFAAMDTSQSGRIEFSEFEAFYLELLKHTTAVTMRNNHDTCM
jgi:Ca2+-binding EF-hand superfamily protein